MTLHHQIERFLADGPHAVIGASNDRSKFGNKVLRAYMSANRTVYPINPNEDNIEGLKCYPDLASLPESVHGISIITPPKVTESIIDQAGELGINNVWLQPGAESEKAVARATDLGMNLIYYGPCILLTPLG